VTLNAATPAGIAPGQMIVLRGSDMPATTAAGILFKQGAAPEVPASYVFTASPNLVIARSPAGLAAGAATVRSATATATTASLPVTIGETPAAPLLTGLRATCSSGSNITTVVANQQVFVLADGVDTAGTTIVWTPGGGGPALTTASAFTTGGPGAICTETHVPAALSAGSWSLQIRTKVGVADSPLSNAVGITIIVP
jgi:hypothetical protein